MASKTIRVRIPVLVAPDGRWVSTGWDVHGDNILEVTRLDDMVATATDMLPPDVDDRGYRISWVEADVPLPEPASAETVKGTVTDG